MPKRKRAKLPVLAGPPDEQASRRFIELLNTEEYWRASLISGKKRIGGDYKPVRAELRRLVEGWTRSKRNVSKLFDALPDLSSKAADFRPFYVPTSTNTARLAYLAVVEYSDQIKPREIAIELFLRFLLNPFNDKLGGPCKYCNAYFFRETEHRSVYCSRLCALRFTSRAAQKKSRDAQTAQNIQAFTNSVAGWRKSAKSKEWKGWVSADTGISKNWLTRAVKRGLIQEPVRKLPSESKGN